MFVLAKLTPFQCCLDFKKPQKYQNNDKNLDRNISREFYNISVNVARCKALITRDYFHGMIKRTILILRLIFKIVLLINSWKYFGNFISFIFPIIRKYFRLIQIFSGTWFLVLLPYYFTDSSQEINIIIILGVYT